ncbi:hypothetical protein TNIN_98371 [Trichonephila inaurata madagascariensis]|uniref:Uncharacterized protein n=1 Tax=Trichonephila inaurata madagascariensis TaxID=2747483 RepID=A0A8X6Y5D0_9ARAC|nr:hypothetical protein TNIN_98371 [Trichonephila inaurata madagascariensis]
MVRPLARSTQVRTCSSRPRINSSTRALFQFFSLLESRHIFEYFGNDYFLVGFLVVQSLLRRFAMTGRKDRTGGSASNNSYENSSSDAEESENNDERNWSRKSSSGESVDSCFALKPLSDNLNLIRTIFKRIIVDKRIGKSINKEQNQFEICNSETFLNDKSAANGLVAHFQFTSWLNFTSEDRTILKRACNVISMVVIILTSETQSWPNLSAFREYHLVLDLLDLSKSLRPVALYSQMLKEGNKG